MKLAEFDYTLPGELIAQYPADTRGADRLLVLERPKNSFEEKKFEDIVSYFRKDDLLVLNDTKVIPARLFGKRETGGRVEIFILERDKNPVEALVRPGGRIKDGEVITLESGDKARIGKRHEIGRFVEFERSTAEILKDCGHVPLPPYISRSDEERDRERYQTIYAGKEGATASHTAGLHFTDGIFEKLKEKGVKLAYVTLHVSYGTFAPVKEEIVEEHRMHSEFYSISKENAIMINEACGKKARVFACGTTSLRALETCADELTSSAYGVDTRVDLVGRRKGLEGFTSLYVYPGYKFRVVNALITNFHLPKSTLLLLTSAFAGKELLFKAYDYAIRDSFRFFSYGDAMLIL